MFSSLVSAIKSDRILFGFAVLVFIFFMYLVVMRINMYLYTQKHDKRPLHYKIFRVYSKNLINNCPSKSEKKFYKKTNKITYFFNSSLIFVFMVVLYITLK